MKGCEIESDFTDLWNVIEHKGMLRETEDYSYIKWVSNVFIKDGTRLH